MTGPLILGIESSCDETGVGLVRGTELLANEVASSVDQHIRFGGVVPEVASRAHLEALLPTLHRAQQTADVDLSQIDGIAVTAGPGLMGALVVGLAAAKALAYALDKPLYGVNHLAGHVAVDLVEHGPLPQPCLALLVSGGHTQLLRVFRVLLAENVSLKDIVPIATTLVDSSETTKDPILLAAEVRCALRRQIVTALFGQKTEMRAFNLGGDLDLFTRLIREEVHVRARSMRLPKNAGHCTVSFHYQPRDNRRRDVDNLMPTMKAACDALVDAQLVPDDTPDMMTKHMPIIHPAVKGEGGKCWLTISVVKP